jgi:ATP-binding cassette subfamily B protein
MVRDSAAVSRLLAYMKPHKALLALSIGTAIVSTGLGLFVPVLVGDGIDALVGVGQVDWSALWGILATLAVVIAVVVVTQWAHGYVTNRLSCTVIRDLRETAYRKLEDVPVSYVDTHAHGDILARIVADAEQVGDGLLQGMTQLFSGVVTIVGTLVFMACISWPVAIVVVCLTPFTMLVAWFIAHFSQTTFEDVQKLQGRITGYAEERLDNQKLVYAFGQGPESMAGFSVMNDELNVKGERAQFISSLSNPGTRFVNNVIYAAVAIIGCFACITSWPAALSIGGVQAFLSYATQYTKPFNDITGVLAQIETALAAAVRIFELIDAPAQTPDAPGAKTLGAGKGSVRFEHVKFCYVPEKPILKDISFEAKPGQRFAIVGPTGCGKTTLINLLLRFYDADGGHIYVDGHDTRELTRESLRAQFGMVLQDTWLFKGTIRENIAYGKPDATEEEIVAAAKRACAYNFIRRMPQGFDTVVDDDAANLSAGEKQLLCIARVMLVDPAILLLDEATSSIDTRTELLVQEAFDAMIEGRTSLIVAHRLSTIRNADCILVMKDGYIIESGTHDELLAQGGFYANLYESQWASAEEEEEATD